MGAGFDPVIRPFIFPRLELDARFKSGHGVVLFDPEGLHPSALPAEVAKSPHFCGLRAPLLPLT